MLRACIAYSGNFLSGQRVSLALSPCAVYFHGLCTDQQPFCSPECPDPKPLIGRIAYLNR